MDKLYQDEAWLREQYITNGLSTYDIAALLKIGETTVRRWMITFGIDRRLSDVVLRQSAISKGVLEKLNDAAWLKDQRFDLNRTNGDIAKELSVNCITVARWFSRHDIPKKQCLDPMYRNESWLAHQYIDLQLSMKEISKLCECTPSSIHKWLRVFKIPIRPSAVGCRMASRTPDLRQRRSVAKLGNRNPAWQGGISFEPYCPKFDDTFKERVRSKFNHRCFLCPKTEAENGRKLSVHHIDYNKNSICKGRDWAFVPLCSRHHALSNNNRWYWFNKLIYYWLDNPEIHLNSF